MSDEFYINLVTMIGLFLINYVKFRADTVISRRKSDNSHQALTDKINGLEIVVKEDLVNREFRANLESSISRKSFDIISSNTDLTDEFINILNLLQIKVKNFAISYSNSQYRENKKIVENYLEIEINTVKEAIKHASNDAFTGKKKDLKFFDFIRYINPAIDTNTNVLIQILTKNGLSKDDYIGLFEKFIKDMLLDYIKSWRQWERS